jgi:endogenous inhibitor of DNA gyrase (YacG/DUF329 family)
MTSPVEEIRVECPTCGTTFDDWTRGSINLDLDDFDDDYVRRASTATCPSCGQVVDLGALVVKDGVWRFPPAYAEAVAPLLVRTPEPEKRARAETDPAAAALRKLDPENRLLRPDAFRGTLWLQAVAWEIDRLVRSKAESD